MTMTSSRLTLLLALTLAVTGCEEEITTEPLPPLDPVSRVAALNWTVSEAPDWDQLAEMAGTYGPTSIFLTGDLSPRLDEDGGASAAAALTTLDARLEALGLQTGLGLEVGVLGSGAPDTICFDAQDPTGDPYLLARATAWRDLLEASPLAVDTVLSIGSDPAPWDVDCVCTPCEGVAATALANRMDGAFTAMAQAAADTGRARWWSSALDSATTAEGHDLVEAMDVALAEVRPEASLRVRASSTMGPDHIWAPETPWLADGTFRELAAELDLVGSIFGPTQLIALFPDDLHDRIQRNRPLGVQAWFASIDGAGRTPWDRPEEANVYFVERLFRDLDITAEELLVGWVEREYGLTQEGVEGQELAVALRNTGRAISLVTHPLGVAVADIEAGVPSLPLQYVDPRPWDLAWEQRWASVNSPDTQTLVDVNQWGAEGVGLAEDALLSFADAEGALPAAVAADLRGRLLLLHVATRAWKLVVGADLTLKAHQAEPSDDRAIWLRHDALELEALADEVDAAVADGTLTDTFPVDPETLRAVALQLRAELGDGSAYERPFPTITQVRFGFEEDQTNVYWTLRPGGASWWERGTGWPHPYDSASETGEGPSVYWHAYTRIDPDERVVFRACGQVEDYTVCASDNVLWTRP
jgi:hypothetical protein